MSSSPSISNSKKTFKVTPFSNLSRNTTYKIRLTTGVKDSEANPLSSQWTTNSGYTTSWTILFGTPHDENATDVTTDSSGNVYLTGWTEGELDGNSNSGLHDLFVVKYNSSGMKQWTRQMGTSTEDKAMGIATDSSDNVYVTGRTGAFMDGNTGAGDGDLFVVKYNSSGTKQWTRQMGTSFGDAGMGIATDSSDNIYLVGSTSGGIDGNSNADPGKSDFFIVKYNSSGTKQWTRQLGTPYFDYVKEVATDSSGNAYATGYTEGDFDGNNNTGDKDIFIVKYNSSGTKQWSTLFGTSSDDFSNAITIDNTSNIYMAGTKLYKYNSSGNSLWSASQTGNSLTTDSSGNIYLADGLHFIKFNSSGDELWSKNIGVNARSLAIDFSGFIYLTGYTESDLDSIINEGKEDIFLIKYDSNGTKY